jgi:hypothetical protein
MFEFRVDEGRASATRGGVELPFSVVGTNTNILMLKQEREGEYG